MILFVIISILIHIFTILAIVVLYQRRSLERLNLPSLEEDVETIHQSIESFIDEIEKENDALYQKIAEHLEEKEKELIERIRQLEKKLEDAEASNKAVLTPEPISEEREPQRNHDNYLPKMRQVAELYRQGLSVELISKTLDIGKGEVSLMINLLEKAK